MTLVVEEEEEEPSFFLMPNLRRTDCNIPASLFPLVAFKTVSGVGRCDNRTNRSSLLDLNSGETLVFSEGGRGGEVNGGGS